jgi:serine/threonine protein kinase
MGQVYRAHDIKLNRDVALKILPDAFANDSDRLARFTREAQTLASLNHPHIAGIYGLEESNGVRALVMELVEGEDLSQRMARGPIPLDEALPTARQIAEALEAAHEQGIIHRDLKPANVKVRPDGTEGAGFRISEARRSNRRTTDNRRHSDVAVAHNHVTRDDDGRWHVAGDCGVYVTRAGEGKASRQAKRHLGIRLRALRDADGHPSIRW